MMTREQLYANRKCAYGGGRVDCPCNGNCNWLRKDDQKPTMTQRILSAERSERMERGD